MKKLLQTLCLVFFACILTACGGDSPEKTAKTFFEELFSGDASKAVELIYIPPEAGDKGAEMAKGKITMMAGEMQAQIKKEGSIDVSTGEVTYTNADKTEATVKITLTGKKNGKEHSETNNVRLIKTDKGWRIKM
ncbi:DUF4878 domain-containing protein [uncultured Cardiobacterium sp.]|mgnify:FL=1|uniref:DUF4878 domain-containing protein n=1 Tax=uncultured Cardiobacterium sp. TaxID=417619 RepID=UPI00260E8044|nr:DUF4878 domain-containing protein [uncultured Cardiobacterium sp.]